MDRSTKASLKGCHIGSETKRIMHRSPKSAKDYFCTSMQVSFVTKRQTENSDPRSCFQMLQPCSSPNRKEIKKSP